MPELKFEIIESLDEVNKKEWNDVVKTCSMGNYFHSFEWLHAMEKTEKVKPRHFIVKKKDSIIAIFPNVISPMKGINFDMLRSVSPPHGGPLVLKYEKEVLNIFFDEIEKMCKNKIATHEIYLYHPNYTRYANFLRDRGYAPEISCSFILNTSIGITNIKIKARHNVSNSDNNFEFRIEEPNNHNLKEFFNFYSEAMKKKNGYIWPLDFFKELSKESYENIQLISLYYKDEKVSGKFNILDRDNSVYHAVFNGMVDEYLKYYSNYFVTWKCIEYCQNNDFKYMELGVTSSDFRNGIFSFKDQWNGRLFPIIYWKKDYSKIKMNLFNLGKIVNDRLHIIKD